MNIQHTDLAAEYLREVDQRLAGLPVLQRRELLADLRAHIETERVERNLSESELIEVLERLGSPDVIAAAAHEEAAVQGRPGPAGDAGAYGWPSPAGDAGAYGWPSPAGDAGAYGWPSGSIDAGLYGWPSPPSDAAAPRQSAGPRRYWLYGLAAVALLFAGFVLMSLLVVARSEGPAINQEGPVQLAPPLPPDPTLGG